ncbi:MAG: alpha/beta hydrolase fold domain-containing protein [Isosphaeraceae bacterium]
MPGATRFRFPRLISTLRLAMATSGTACAVSLALPALSGVTQNPGEVFRKFDRDGNGRLSREELPEQARPNFDRADTDGDGGITPDEDAAFRKRLNGPREPAKLADSVQVIENVPYAPTDNPKHRLDLLLPRKPQGDRLLPVVIYIHGGAWRGGDRKGGFGALGPLVASGDYAGVTASYRLTDEATWPAQIHDCKAVVRWVRANASKYHLDPNKIAAMGSSAGGHLVAMLGTSGDVAALEGNVGPHHGVSSEVQCVADLYGPAELSRMGLFPSSMDHEADDSPESLLIGGPLLKNPDAARAASPVSYVSADDPPFLIIHGTKDDVVPYDQSARLHDALHKAGVQTTLIPVERGGHGNFGNPEIPLRIQTFFDKHLRGQDVSVPDSPVPARQTPAKKGLLR